MRICVAAAGQGSAPCHQRARRQDIGLAFLETFIRATPLPSAASSHCEPDSGKPATWHWFAVNGEHERELFAFPGIWQRWKGPVKKDGPTVELDVYSFMTTTPNALTDSINHERMPVLLSKEDEFNCSSLKFVTDGTNDSLKGAARLSIFQVLRLGHRPPLDGPLSIASWH